VRNSRQYGAGRSERYGAVGRLLVRAGLGRHEGRYAAGPSDRLFVSGSGVGPLLAVGVVWFSSSRSRGRTHRGGAVMTGTYVWTVPEALLLGDTEVSGA